MDFNGVIMISSGDSDAEWTELLNPVTWILFRALSIWLSLMQTGGMQFLSLLRLAVDHLPTFCRRLGFQAAIIWDSFATSGVRLRRHAARSRRLETRQDHDLQQSIAAFLWVLTSRSKFSYSFSFCWIQRIREIVSLCVVNEQSYFVSH